MSKFNITIQNNNTDLQEILNTINALSEAGSGTSENLDDVLGVQDNIITQLEQAIAGKAIGGGGIDTSDATATENDILLEKTAYVNGQKITGKIDTAKQAVPTLSINSSTGLITANATQMRGYIPSDGTITKTMQLAFAPAKTITPGASSQIAVSSGYYTGGNIIVAGDANLIAGNIKKGTTIFGVSGNYEGSGGSGTEVEYSANEDDILDGDLTTYTNDRITKLKEYAFYYCSRLTLISFPACITIGSNAFYRCSKLTSVNFSSCTSIGTNAFYRCSNLTSVNFPICISIGNGAFHSCKLASVNFPACTSIGVGAFYYGYNLTSINFPACTNIGDQAFYSCSKLTSINFPTCTSIGVNAFCDCTGLVSVSFPVCSYIGTRAFDHCFNLVSVSFPVCSYIGTRAFDNCSSLTSVNFPICTSIAGWAFDYCSSLTSVNFPICTSIGDYAFDYCSSLTSVNFPICTSIGNGAFNQCSNLTSLTLGASSVATLANANAFLYTPMSLSTLTGSFGSIYVPASLVNAYKTATNWATYASRITAIPTGRPSGGADN